MTFWSTQNYIITEAIQFEVTALSRVLGSNNARTIACHSTKGARHTAWYIKLNFELPLDSSLLAWICPSPYVSSRNLISRYGYYNPHQHQTIKKATFYFKDLNPWLNLILSIDTVYKSLELPYATPFKGIERISNWFFTIQNDLSMESLKLVLLAHENKGIPFADHKSNGNWNRIVFSNQVSFPVRHLERTPVGVGKIVSFPIRSNTESRVTIGVKKSWSQTKWQLHRTNLCATNLCATNVPISWHG